MVVAGLAIAAWGAGCGREDTPTGAQGTVASSTSGTGGMGGAGGAACVPNDPPIEVCDYIDNDCNGVVDEGFDFGCGHIKSDTDGDGIRDELELPVHRVSLAPGSYEVVEATLRVPPTAEGERLRARLHVQSEANPYMAAEASTQLDVHP